MAGGCPPEERLTIGPPGRVLEAMLALPPGPPRAGAVVCHPHPEYGGAMDNPVVVAITDGLAADGWATLRFNFGGVGRSAGGFTGGPGEVEDVRVAMSALCDQLPPGTPLALVGYSFGAWAAIGAATGMGAPLRQVVAVGPPLAFFTWTELGTITVPVTFVVGDRDQYCPRDRLATVLAEHARVTCRTLAGADHFLGGREREVAVAVAESLRALGG